MAENRTEEAHPTRCDLTSRVSFPERVLFRDLGSEAVILDLEAGRYYGLDEVGLRMVLLLQEHGRIEPVLHALLDEYAVPRDQLRFDLLSFVDLLASRRLLLIDDP